MPQQRDFRATGVWLRTVDGQVGSNPKVRFADHPFVAEFFASQKPLPAEYKQIAPFLDAGHSYRSSLVPKPAYK